MTLQELINKKAKRGMTVISDVDGVHTTRAGGVRIGPKLEAGQPLIEVKDGLEILRLVPADVGARDIEVVLGGFSGLDVWEFYRFHTPDGQAVQNLLKANIRTIITSGRKAAPVQHRFGKTLQYDCGESVIRPEVYLGVKDKLQFFSDMNVDFSNSFFIADGAQYAPLLEAVRKAGGISIATADAEEMAIKASDIQTQAKGGEGAFAELVQAYLDFIK